MRNNTGSTQHEDTRDFIHHVSALKASPEHYGVQLDIVGRGEIICGWSGEASATRLRVVSAKLPDCCIEAQPRKALGRFETLRLGQ